MTKIAVIGFSHTRALSRALDARKSAGRPSRVEFDIRWLLSQKGKFGDLSEDDAIAIASGLGEHDILGISLVGAFHNMAGLMRHEIPFDVIAHEAEAAPIEDGSTLIPESALAEMIIDLADRTVLIRALQKATRAKMVYIAFPPPKEDNAFIAACTQRNPAMAVGAEGISPPRMRRKLWELEMRVLRDHLGEWGIAYLPVPADSLSEQGFLANPYYAEDATHANTAYGELVLRQLEELAGSSRLLANGRGEP